MGHPVYTVYDGFRFSALIRDFSLLPHRSDRLWGPPSFLCNEYAGFVSLGLKRLGREAEHSPPSSVEVRNCGASGDTAGPRLEGPEYRCQCRTEIAFEPRPAGCASLVNYGSMFFISVYDW
jgi:hypothetical protein